MKIDLKHSIRECTKQDTDKKTKEIIEMLKTARRMYISLKEQHCQKSILQFWGNECIRLRQKLKDKK